MKIALLVVAIAVVIIMPAQAAEYVKWSWSTNLSAKIASGGEPTHRTAAEADSFFRSRYRGGTIEELVAYLGKPHGFSRQAPGSKTLGTAEPCYAGGTLRFCLTAGDELHVRTDGELHQVYEAIRYDKKGKGTLLYK